MGRVGVERDVLRPRGGSEQPSAAAVARAATLIGPGSIFHPAVSSAGRPRGRRPGASGTRETILAAARARFAAHGYDRTRIRDVAQDAGVDAALVHYFFGSKDGLFVAAMELPLRPAEVIGPLLDAGVAGLGERLVRRLLGVWDDPREPRRPAGDRARRERPSGGGRGAARVHHA